MKKYYTIKELAKETGIAESTARRYISNFEDFFTYQGGSRSRKYEETAIKVLARIKILFDSGYETTGVHAALMAEFPLIVDDDQAEQDSKAPALATAADVEEIKEQLKQYKEFNRVLIERLDNQDRKLEERDRQLLETLEALKQQTMALAEPREEKSEEVAEVETEAKEETKEETAEKQEKPSLWQRIFNNKKA